MANKLLGKSAAYRYVKNVGRSFGYIAKDIFVTNNPQVTEMMRSTIKFRETLYSDIKDFKTTIKGSADGEGIFDKGRKISHSAIHNIYDDLSSGNWYNAERRESADNEMFKNMMGTDFDNFDAFDGFDDNFGEESDTEESPSISVDTKASMLADRQNVTDVINSMDSIGDKIVKGTGAATVKSVEYLDQVLERQNAAMYSLHSKGYQSITTGLAAINDNLSSIMQLKPSLLQHMQNSTTFYTTITDISNKILDILTSLKTYIIPDKKTSATIERKNRMSYIMNNGALDLTAYWDMIKSNISDSVGGILGIADAVGGPEALINSMISNPVSSILSFGINNILPRTLKSSMKSFNTAIEDAVAGMFTKLGETSFEGAFGTAFDYIKEYILPKRRFKNSIDTSRYEKGRVEWSGTSKKALEEVIPTYLSEIVSALTGAEPTRFDYNNGKFVTVSSIIKANKDRLSNAAKSAGGDFRRDAFRAVNNMGKYSNGKLDQNTLDRYKSEIDNFMEYLFINGGAPLLNINKPGFDYKAAGLSKESYNIIKGLMSQSNTNKSGTYKSRDLHLLSSMRLESDRYSDEVERLENSGLNPFVDAFNDSSIIRNKAKSTSALKNPAQRSAGTSFLTSTVDEYNHNIFFYLQGIWLANRHLAQNLPIIGAKTQSLYTYEKNPLASSTQWTPPANIVPKEEDASLKSSISDKDDTEMSSIISNAIKQIELDDTSIRNRNYRVKMGSGNTEDIKASIKSKLSNKGLLVNNENPFDMFNGINLATYLTDDEIADFVANINKEFGEDALTEKLEEEYSGYGATFVNSFKKIYGQVIKIINQPAQVVSELLASGTSSLYNLIFGTDEKSAGGIFGYFMNKAENIFSTANNWLKDKFDFSVKGWFENLFDGEDGIKANLKNAFKFFGFGGNKKSAEVENAAYGREVKKTGIVAVSEGELVIPSDYNPNYHGSNDKKYQLAKEDKAKNQFYKKAAAGNIDGTESFWGEYAEGGEVKEQGSSWGGPIDEKINQAKSLVYKSFMTLSESVTNFTKKIIPENVEDDANIIGQKVQDFFKNKGFGKEVEQNAGGMGAGALIGAGASLFTGLLFGPLTGAALGAGIGLLTKSKAAQDLLFGELDEEGERKGGIFSKKISDMLTKHLPSAVKGAGRGFVGGLFLGSPILGAMLGASISYAHSSEKFKTYLFGNPDDLESGLIKRKYIENLKGKLPHIGAGVLATLASPLGVGLIPTLLFGGTMGYLTTTDEFHKFLYGDDGTGGVAKMLKDRLFGTKEEPGITEGIRQYLFGDKEKKDIHSDLGLIGNLQYIMKSYAEAFTDSLKNITKRMYRSIQDWWSKFAKNDSVQRYLMKPLAKIAGGILGTGARAVKNFFGMVKGGSAAWKERRAYEDAKAGRGKYTAEQRNEIIERYEGNTVAKDLIDSMGYEDFEEYYGTASDGGYNTQRRSTLYNWMSDEQKAQFLAQQKAKGNDLVQKTHDRSSIYTFNQLLANSDEEQLSNLRDQLLSATHLEDNMRSTEGYRKSEVANYLKNNFRDNTNLRWAINNAMANRNLTERDFLVTSEDISNAKNIRAEIDKLKASQANIPFYDIYKGSRTAGEINRLTNSLPSGLRGEIINSALSGEMSPEALEYLTGKLKSVSDTNIERNNLRSKQSGVFAELNAAFPGMDIDEITAENLADRISKEIVLRQNATKLGAIEGSDTEEAIEQVAEQQETVVDRLSQSNEISQNQLDKLDEIYKTITSISKKIKGLNDDSIIPSNAYGTNRARRGYAAVSKGEIIVSPEDSNYESLRNAFMGNYALGGLVSKSINMLNNLRDTGRKVVSNAARIIIEPVDKIASSIKVRRINDPMESIGKEGASVSGVIAASTPETEEAVNNYALGGIIGTNPINRFLGRFNSGGMFGFPSIPYFGRYAEGGEVNKKSEIDPTTGESVQYVKNNQGEWIKDMSDSETRKSETQKTGFFSSIMNLGTINSNIAEMKDAIIGLKNGMIGGDKDKKPGILSRIFSGLFGKAGVLAGLFSFFTGQPLKAIGSLIGSGFTFGAKMLGLGKTLISPIINSITNLAAPIMSVVAPLTSIAASGTVLYKLAKNMFTGESDETANKITKGAYGHKGGQTQFIQNADGTTTTVTKNENGEFVTDSGNVVDADQVYTEKSELDTLSTRTAKDIARGAVSGRGLMGKLASVTTKGIGALIDKIPGAASIVSPAKAALTSLIDKAKEKGGGIIMDMVTKIFNMVTAGLYKMLPDAAKNVIPVVVDKLKNYVLKLGAGPLGKWAAKVATTLGFDTVTAGIRKAAVLALDLTTGWQDAASTFGILPSMVSNAHAAIASLLRTLKNFFYLYIIPDSFLVDIFVEHIGPFFGLDFTALKEQRDFAQKVVDEYNANPANRDKQVQNVAEYNKQVLGDRTWTESIAHGVTSAWDSAKNAVSSFFSGDKETETAKPVAMPEPAAPTVKIEQPEPVAAAEETKSEKPWWKFWGSGSGLEVKYNGRLPYVDPNNQTFVSQLDNRYADKAFGESNIKDLGCGPAAATMAANLTKPGSMTMDKAIQIGAKYVTNEGTNPEYIEEVFRQSKISPLTVKNASDIKALERNILNGTPAVLMGSDPENTSKEESPFGPKNHYVTINGVDSHGQLLVNDPESTSPSKPYGMASVMKGVKAAIVPRSDDYKESVDNAQSIWNYLMKFIKNPFGVAGLMGNLQAESKLKANIVQRSNKGNAMSDAEYTQGVDAGSYNNFTNDSKGYGLAQWTYSTRKKALLESAKKAGVSIGDYKNQLDYLLRELQSGEYRNSVYMPLLEAKSVEDASNAVLHGFEKPAKQGPDVEKRRAGYGKTIYDKYSSLSGNEEIVFDQNSDNNEVSKAIENAGLASIMSSSGGIGKIIQSGLDTLNDLFKQFLGIDVNLSADSIAENIRNGMGSSDGIKGLATASSVNYNDLPTNNSKETPEFSPNAKIDERQKQLVAMLDSKVGKLKYSQQLRNPDKGASDCSSLVNWAYKKVFGVDVGNNTGAMITNKNTMVVDDRAGNPDISKLQPGDIMLYKRGFSNRPYKVGHVEMYTGDNRHIGHGGKPALGPVYKPMSRDVKNYIQSRRLIDLINPETTTPDDIEKSNKLTDTALEQSQNVTTETTSKTTSKEIQPGASGSGLIDQIKPQPIKVDPSKFKAPDFATDENKIMSSDITSSEGVTKIVDAISALSNKLDTIITNTRPISTISTTLTNYCQTKLTTDMTAIESMAEGGIVGNNGRKIGGPARNSSVPRIKKRPNADPQFTDIMNTLDSITSAKHYGTAYG